MTATLPIWFSFGLSLLVALFYGIIGYANSLAEDNATAFDYKKFATTVIISIIVGIVMWYQGIEATIENAATWTAVIASQAGIVYFINKAVSIVLKMLEPAEEQPPATT